MSGLLVQSGQAGDALAQATTAAEVLDARDIAGRVYDAAKAAARFARAKGAHDELVAAAHRAQADALEIEASAKRKLADEYEAAQERGEASVRGQHASHVGDGDMRAKITDLGLTRQQMADAREIRDAERDDPGIIHRTLQGRLAAGQEPSKAALREALRGGTSNVVDLSPRLKPIQPFDEIEREGLAQAAAEEHTVAGASPPALQGQMGGLVAADREGLGCPR